MTAPESPPPAAAGPAPKPLIARVVGVVLSPTAAYTAVAAHPRGLGAMLVALVLMIVPNALFLSTETGQQALLERQLAAMEAFGATVTDEMLDQLEGQLPMVPYTTALSQVIVVPLTMAIVSGLLLGVFSGLLAGSARYAHVFAVVAHASVIVGLQQLFAMPISYARGEMAQVTTAASFFPMFEPGSAPNVVLSTLDFFLLWWVVNLAIGLSVLYARPLRATVWPLLGLYAVVAVVIIGVRLAV